MIDERNNPKVSSAAIISASGADIEPHQHTFSISALHIVGDSDSFPAPATGVVPSRRVAVIGMDNRNYTTVSSSWGFMPAAIVNGTHARFECLLREVDA